MNTSIKTFACAAVVSMLLLSCNDTTGLNASGGDDINATAAEKNATATEDGKLKPPNDPAVVIIADDVQQWMEDQLASKSGEKKLISIFEMYRPKVSGVADELSASYNSAGETEYYLNGQKISSEEYKKWAESDKQRTSYNKRDLSIPGEIIYDSSRKWTVLITAEGLTELIGKYSDIAIEFYVEPENE